MNVVVNRDPILLGRQSGEYAHANISIRLVTIFTLAVLLCNLSHSSVHAEQSPILLITLDTLRADRLGVYGDPTAYTPNIDQNSVGRFLYIDSWTDVPMTLPAHTSLLTGLPLEKHGIMTNGIPISASLATIPEQLRKQGYRTAAVIGGYPLSASFGLSRGFDIYDDRLDRPIKGSTAERLGEDVIESAIRLIVTSPAPLFLWVHLYDPHAPYNPPPIYRNLSDYPYDGEVAYTDRCVGTLLRAWQDRFGTTGMQIICADHGEALGSHQELTHGVFLYQETLRIPVIVHFPSGFGSSAGLTPDPMPIYNLLPTIFRKINLPFQPEFPVAPSVIATRYPFDRFHWSPLQGFRTGKWKYIGSPEPELYDLTDDPAETENVAFRFPDMVDEYRRNMPDLFARMETTGEISSQTREALESLGYAQPSRETPEASLLSPRSMAGLLIPIEEALDAVNSEQWRVAAQLLKQILTEDPENPTCANNMGLVLVQLNRCSEAIPYFQTAARHQPTDAQIQNNLGVAFRKLKRYDDAIATFQKSIALDPEFGAARVNLALAQFSGGRNAESRRTLDDALQMDPSIRHMKPVQDLLEQLQQKTPGNR